MDGKEDTPSHPNTEVKAVTALNQEIGADLGAPLRPAIRVHFAAAMADSRRVER